MKKKTYFIERPSKEHINNMIEKARKNYQRQTKNLNWDYGGIKGPCPSKVYSQI